MKALPDRHAEQWVVMQARRLGCGRSPLRRRIDRIESTVVLLALLGALLAVPVGAAVGTSVRGLSERHDAVRRAVIQPVQARTTRDVPIRPTVAGQVATMAPVEWQDASGALRQGSALVFLGTKADAEVTIWLDRSGEITAPPRQPGDSAALGGVVGLTAVMTAWAALWLLVLLARRLLDRRRWRDWQDEWQRVEPRWSSQD